MRIDILTIFPEMFAPLKTSILGKAVDNGLVDINYVDIRSFSREKHGKVDDYVFGGGDGMLMMPEPIYDAVMSVKQDNSHVIYMSPKGKVLNQNIVKGMANYEHLIIICGHYEGIDQRVIDLVVDEEISIGDYVLTGGEIPAMVLVDCVARYIPNVLHSATSTLDESFSDGMLEYPQYTRPREFMGLKVPDVLINGNHKLIAEWKEQMKQKETKEKRIDLLVKDNKE